MYVQTNGQMRGRGVVQMTKIRKSYFATLILFYRFFCFVWDPLATFKVERDKILYKNKLSPYFGWSLQRIDSQVILRFLQFLNLLQFL